MLFKFFRRAHRSLPEIVTWRCIIVEDVCHGSMCFPPPLLSKHLSLKTKIALGMFLHVSVSLSQYQLKVETELWFLSALIRCWPLILQHNALSVAIGSPFLLQVDMIWGTLLSSETGDAKTLVLLHSRIETQVRDSICLYLLGNIIGLTLSSEEKKNQRCWKPSSFNPENRKLYFISSFRVVFLHLLPLFDKDMTLQTPVSRFQ